MWNVVGAEWTSTSPNRIVLFYVMRPYLLVNQREKYHMVPWICKNLHTFMYSLPTILPCSGRYSGQMCANVCKFLQIHGTIWYFSRWFTNSSFCILCSILQFCWSARSLRSNHVPHRRCGRLFFDIISYHYITFSRILILWDIWVKKWSLILI
jgi:hypothetical protein